MQNKIMISATGSLLLVCSALASAQSNPTQLSTVEVTASPATVVAPLAGQEYSVSHINADGVATLGGGAQANPYHVLDLVPSVNMSGSDAYGLSVDQNFMRVRGISSYTYSTMAVTVNGTPSSVSVAQGGMGNLFDLDNVDGIKFWRGPQPGNVGFGFGNLAGALDVKLKAPAEKAGATVRAAIGSDSFSKLFARVDTGTFGYGTRVFLSSSTAQTDKWRGAGEQSRETINIGIVQPLGERGSLELYGAHNRFRRDEYRSLTYAQTRDLGTYKNFDYNATLTRVPATDASYYGYNTQSYEEDNVFAKFTWKLGDDSLLSLRPYWLSTDGTRMTGSASGAAGSVNLVTVNQEQSGVVAEVMTKLAGQTVTAGYWSQRITTMPPPLSQKRYTLNNQGQRVFAAWSILADMGAREYDSPYLQLAGGSGNWNYSAGLRYLRFTMPGITTYNGAGLPDTSRENALALNPPVNAGLLTRASSMNELMPSFSSRWKLDTTLDAKIAFGRTVGNPWMGPLYSAYQNNVAAFQAAGIPLQKLWDTLKLEKSDTVEGGLEWRLGAVSLAPTIFYSRLRDKQVTAFDPVVGVSYLQSGVNATAYGAELEASWAANNNWNLIGALSYNVNRLDDDIRTGGNAVLASKGKQVPDAPKWLAKLGAEYRSGPWSVMPLLRYTGSRYGDALNTERVDAYATADVSAAYRVGKLADFASLELGLSIQNLFDKQYIGSINVGQDDARPGAIGYYPGAPRTMVLSLTANY
jgi:iron complex outermembrane receptor protein